jgi:hypothetical protein
MKDVAASALRGCRHDGHRGDALPRNLPPHGHGATYGSTSNGIDPCETAKPEGAVQWLDKVALPQESQICECGIVKAVVDKHVREAETASVTNPLPIFAKPVTHVMPKRCC